jgi:hypothetical protein
LVTVLGNKTTEIHRWRIEDAVSYSHEGRRDGTIEIQSRRREG